MSGGRPMPNISRDLVPYEYGAPWLDEQSIDMLEAKSGAFGFTPEEEAILLGGGVPSAAGIFVGPEQAKLVSAAWACRRVISEDVAKMPRALKRISYDAQQRRRAAVDRAHPVAHVLERPNEWMTGMEFFEWLVGVATFHEGAYALITRDEYGRVQELLPLIPGSVTCDHVPGSRWELIYRVSGYGDTIVAEPGQLLKLRGPLRDDYLRGQSVSHLAREAIGLAAALEQSQARFHGDDMRPSGGILTAKAVGLTADQRKEIKTQWESQYRRGGEGGIAVMDGDWDFKATNPTSADSQVIENRKFQIEEVCRFFRVFPQIIGHSQGSVGYNGHEQLLNAHGEHSLLPWVLRLEQACERDLLTEEEYRDGYRVDIDQDATKRGTLSDRVNAYDKAVKIYKTPNEIRAEEGLDPIDDPAMDRVQLQANNTGMLPRGAEPHADAVTGRIADLESTITKQFDAARASVAQELDARLLPRR